MNSMCERCHVSDCIYNYLGDACREARLKDCPDVCYTNADKLRDMDEYDLAKVIGCPKEFDGIECPEGKDCARCKRNWLFRLAE